MNGLVEALLLMQDVSFSENHSLYWKPFRLMQTVSFGRRDYFYSKPIPIIGSYSFWWSLWVETIPFIGSIVF